MRELIPDIQRWRQQGKAAALATVVKAYGSSPRPLGAKMAVSSAGEMAGSVSGGCVESAVVQEALEVIASGEPKLLTYGIAEEWAQAAGLACGGEIEVFVERILDADLFETLVRCLENHELVALATVVAGTGRGRKLLVWPDGRSAGELGGSGLNELARAFARGQLSTQQTGRRMFAVDADSSDVFVEVFAPSPRLIVVGAVHIAIPLVSFAKTLGFRTTVIDPRPIFAAGDRFAHADELIPQWPDEILPTLRLDESCYVVVLSHDDKLDIPALSVALTSSARYIGALGSRQTHAQRLARLREQGVSEEQLARIHNPIGLDLGGRLPEEIAIAIIAEIVAVRNGRQERTATRQPVTWFFDDTGGLA